MTKYPGIYLKPGKEAAVKRFHPWLFSGAIRNYEGKPAEGDIVELFSSSKEYLATGHFQNDSIAVKIFSYHQEKADVAFWTRKLQKAFEVRRQLGLTVSELTNAYRLVHTEGDGMPGLIVDFYNGVAVVQSHSMGMKRSMPEIVEALKNVYGKHLKAVYDKSTETLHQGLRDAESGESINSDSYLYGEPQEGRILESGHQFNVNWEKGQKTGFFLDQRANRILTQFYARDRQVLNAFCYSGAFSVYALKGGASMVHSVDSSKQAMEWAGENVELNGSYRSSHLSITADVKKYLSETDDMYDMIILDPPAFAKHHKVSHNALQGYQYINAQAMKKLKKDGILFTFSCSQAISRELFQSAIRAAALETGREIRVIHQLTQSPDHPVNIYHPEGEYLKGLILFVH